MNTNITKPTIMIKTENDEYKVLGKATEISTEYEHVEASEKEYVMPKEITLTMDIKPMNITKKKFVKKLMAKGIGRNGANEIAKYIHKKRGYYSLLDLIIF